MRLTLISDSNAWRMNQSSQSSEAAILDEVTAKRYNQWIADGWKTSVPECINNMGQRDMRFALPYSEKFKQWLRKNN
jgi:hypothetical protein